MAKLTFFFDRQVGKKLPHVLAKMAPPMDVTWHQQCGYRQNMPDDEWLADVGKKKWVVIGQDLKWHLIASEAEAIKQHRVRCFYLPCANEGRWDTLCNVVKHHRHMIELANSVDPPFIFKLKKNGRFSRVQIL